MHMRNIQIFVLKALSNKFLDLLYVLLATYFRHYISPEQKSKSTVQLKLNIKYLEN